MKTSAKHLKAIITCVAPEQWWLRIDPSAIVRLKASAGFLQAMHNAGGSLLITSRSQHRVAIVSVTAGGCIAFISSAPGPMGAAVHGSALALGTAEGIRIYQNVAQPEAEATYIPAAMHYTGRTSVHEVAWGKDDHLWFVNTRFSALCTVDMLSQFRARWRPSFVPDFGGEDCCHLNGMAMADGMPALVTALGEAGDRDGWRRTAPDGGILMRVDHEILRRGLSLPHSPTMRDGKVWVLEAGRGRIFSMTPEGRDETEICRLDGIVRGLAFSAADFFIGLSRPRLSSEAVSAIIETRFKGPSVALLHAISQASGQSLGYAELPFIDEISSVTVLPHKQARIVDPSIDEMKFSSIFIEADSEALPLI